MFTMGSCLTVMSPPRPRSRSPRAPRLVQSDYYYYRYVRPVTKDPEVRQRPRPISVTQFHERHRGDRCHSYITERTVYISPQQPERVFGAEFDYRGRRDRNDCAPVDRRYQERTSGVKGFKEESELQRKIRDQNLRIARRPAGPQAPPKKKVRFAV